MGGFLITQIGQESIPVAVRSMMEPQDHSIGGLRGMGTALLAGMSMKESMAELFGRATGCAKGKGGLFGFFAPEHHHWGGMGMRPLRRHWQQGWPSAPSIRASPAWSFAIWEMAR